MKPTTAALSLWRQRALWMALCVAVLAVACGGSEGSGDQTSASPPAPAPSPSPAPSPAPSPPPTSGALACSAPVVVPPVAACDGILLTDPDSASFRSSGIVASAGPAGSAAWKIGVNDDDHILVKDSPCLRLGKDGTDFTVAMWLKATGDSQILGTGSGIGSGKPGFSINSRNAGNGLVELVVGAGKMHWEETRPFNDVLVSQRFKANEWVHVLLTYDSNGPGKAATFSMWLNLSTNSEPARSTLSADAPFQIYQPNLIVGDQGYGRWAPFEVSEMRSYSRVLTTPEIKALVLAKAGVAGLSVAELKQSTDRLLAHVKGTSLLASAAFGAEVARFEKHSPLMDTDAAATQRALELAAAMEGKVGPLFMTSGTQSGVSANATPGQAGYPALALLKVQQAVFDHAFSASSAQHCTSTLDGKAWLTSEYFPGKVATPPDLSKEHSVRVNATVPAYWGKPEVFSTKPVVRATGLYLSPGGVAEVRVPNSMVGAGFEIRVGAHSQDHGHKTQFSRLPRVSKTFPITSSVTRIASPLGGGMYLMVPYLADKGMQTVTVRGGVVEAPFFSARGFDKTTNAQWRTRRTAPGPWADFESDKFMMQVPSSWIYAFEDPVALMEKWDRAMDGFSEIHGYPPEKRNRKVLYQLVDTDIPWGVYGIGYPMNNNTFDPRSRGNGNVDHWFLRDPLANEIDFHELGHSAWPSYFSGETEAIVNFPYAYIRHIKFGDTFDASFARSMGWSFGDKGRTTDEAALDRMITESFRKGEERNTSNTEKDEVRYQHRGYAHYADIARTFGWDAYTGFLYQENLDWMNPPPSDGLSGDDSRTLRMSVAAQTDLTPLFHFYGIHPDDPVRLKAAMVAKGLTPSPKVLTLLERYYTLIPRNNAEFLAAAETRGLNCDRGASLDYGCGWWSVWRAKYGTTEGTQAQTALRNIIQRYYP